jgi:hypothetical protein
LKKILIVKNNLRIDFLKLLMLVNFFYLFLNCLVISDFMEIVSQHVILITIIVILTVFLLESIEVTIIILITIIVILIPFLLI